MCWSQGETRRDLAAQISGRGEWRGPSVTPQTIDFTLAETGGL